MRTLEELKNKKQTLIANIKSDVGDNKSQVEELELVSNCILLVESGLNADTLKSMRDKVDAKIKYAESRYDLKDKEKFSAEYVRNHRVKFELEHGIPKMNVQLNTLEYVLK
jgi:MoxR-like ATPase